ncbi:hypothetical protein [Vibrio harveyi]|uniref:hypothetical protein n=1 Tax=Vibrio harveyi TaxID=669 RepID=UPI003CF8014F
MTSKNRHLVLAIVCTLCVAAGVGGYYSFKQHVMQQVQEAEIAAKKEDRLASVAAKNLEVIGKVSDSYVYTYKNLKSNMAPSVHIMENLTLVLVDSGESFALNKEIHLVKPGTTVRKGIQDGVEYICLGDVKVSCSTINDKKLVVAM